MAVLDISHTDPFHTISLTTAVEKIPYLPQALESLGVFSDDPIRTEALAVEERDGILTLVPFSDRGAPGVQRTTEERKLRYFSAPRLKVEDTITARELAGIREFGTESELMQVQKELARRLVGPTGLRSLIQYTQEYHKVAAIQGLLLDANGSVVHNWFSEFEITQPATIAFNLLAKTTGSLRPILNELIRSMKRAAKGAWIEGRTRCACLCGDAFFDALITHPDVEKTYLNWADAAELRKNMAFEVFGWGGVDWINYRGSDDTMGVGGTTVSGSNVISNVPAAAIALLAAGYYVTGPNIPAGASISALNSGAGTVTLQGGQNALATQATALTFNMGTSAIAIPANYAKFFPRNAPGVFRRALAPADAMQWINTLGKPEYVQMIFDRDRQEWVKAEMSCYPLHICTRPEILQSGTMDASAD